MGDPESVWCSPEARSSARAVMLLAFNQEV
jgi:hypothetical protein